MFRKYILLISLILFSNFISSQEIKHNSNNNVDLIPYRIGHNWGFSNSKKELKIPAIYSEVELFNEFGLAKVAIGSPNKNAMQFGYIDTLGNEIIDIGKYPYLSEFKDSLTIFEVVEENPRTIKYGLVDTKGNELIAAKYRELKILDNGLIWVNDNYRFGVMDRNGNIIIPFEYNGVSDFSSGLTIVKKNDKYGVLNEKGEEVIPLLFDGLHDSHFEFRDKLDKIDKQVISQKLIPAKKQTNKSSKWGVIDFDGNEIISFKYDYISFFYNGVAVVGNKYEGDKMKLGLINKDGKITFPIKYNGLDNFKYGASYTYINNKAGFININGEKISEFKYDYASGFVNGFAIVGITKEKPNTGRHWSFVNRNGKEITKRYYDKVKDFRDGLAIVELNGKYGLIDTLDQEVIPLNYKSVINFEDYIIIASEDGQFWGINDKSNNVIVPFKYNLIAPVPEKENLFQIMIFDFKTGQTKEGFVDINGTEYFED